MTAAGRRGPRLRWRSRPGNLIDRRGAALVPPVLLAVGLNVAAVTGLAGVAGFHAVHASLIRIQWPWLCAVVAAFAMSATGYYLAYRSVYAAEGGYALSRRQLTAVVAAGFSGLFSTGGIRPDGLVLQAAGASRREAMVRVTTLTGMEQAILALYGCAAAIAWLSLGLPGMALDVTLPWAVIPVPAFAAAARRCSSSNSAVHREVPGVGTAGVAKPRDAGKAEVVGACPSSGSAIDLGAESPHVGRGRPAMSAARGYYLANHQNQVTAAHLDGQ